MLPARCAPLRVAASRVNWLTALLQPVNHLPARAYAPHSSSPSMSVTDRFQ
jgi:hypothetical protein